ncbi:hypothetical protein [Nocardia noduli]|uniref:hypothetical protein n=1 Tax=Nocardia noduli TaxID=2815722 RepID=UPI001C24881C|nr:hypothetical protein [Nocardia noduli]
MMDSSDVRTAQPLVAPDRAAILAGLLGLAEQTVALTDRLLGSAAPVDTPQADIAGEAGEPARTGLYRDCDGDIWQKTTVGWRLCLQRGVAVDSTSVWEWMDGHVRDYGPFVPLAAV